MTHCLITGGAGYIGSRLAARLLAENVRVTVLDNLRRGTVDALQPIRDSVRFVEGDIRDERTLNEATHGVDVVFHLAAESAVLSADADPEYCFSTNVTGTFRALRAASSNGVRRFVLTSSREVYGDPVSIPVPETAPFAPKNAYGSSKAAAEMCCGAFETSGLEVSIVRLSNVYGPQDRGRVIPRFVEGALHDLPLTLFGGQQLMDFVWIDAVVGALSCLGLGPHIPGPLNLGSGKGTSIVELAHRVIEGCASASVLTVAPAKDVEVVRFVADVSAARQAISFAVPQDPLFGLPEVIAAARRRLAAAQNP